MALDRSALLDLLEMMRSGDDGELVTTTAGDLTVKIPKVRTGSFFPRLVNRGGGSASLCTRLWLVGALEGKVIIMRRVLLEAPWWGGHWSPASSSAFSRSVARSRARELLGLWSAA